MPLKKPAASATSADGRTVVEVHLNSPSPTPSGHTIHDHRRVTATGFFRRTPGQRAALAGQDNGQLVPDRWQNHEPDTYHALDIKQKIEKARKHQRNGFLQSIGELRIGYHHHEFQVVPAETRDEQDSGSQTRAPGDRGADRAGGADRAPAEERFKDWWRRVERAVRGLARESWKHWNDVDNVVATWFREYPGKVFLQPAEKCDYLDLMGIPRLKVNLGWNEYKWESSWDQRTTGAKLVKGADRYLKGGSIELSEARGEYFLVLKRAPEGSGGFACPRIDSLLRTLEQDDSMQSGDNVSAFLLRTVIRQFKVGHEIKQGPWAGRDEYFFDAKLHGPAFQERYDTAKVGLVNHAGNFDEEITFPTPDTARFGIEKYAAVWQRIAQWAGPVGLMFLQKDSAGDLLEMARVVTELERQDYMGPFLNEVINRAFAPPEPVRVTWGSRCFLEARIRSEYTKWLQSIGALSEGTALAEADYAQAVEWRRKDVEHAQPKHRTTPLYDAAHGPPDAGGRPAGTKDAGKREQG